MAAMVAEPWPASKRRAVAEPLSDALRALCSLIAPPGGQALALPTADPEQLARAARRHQVESLVVERLTHANADVPPALAAAARRAREAGLRQLSVAIDLQRRFAAVGLGCLFLKGLALSQRAYGAMLTRQSVDIDLLIAATDVPRAWRVLAEAGYLPLNPQKALSGAALGLFLHSAKDSLHRDPLHGVAIELHWRMSDEMAAPALPPPEGWQTVTVSPGVHLETLADADLVVFLCTHGAAHGWARLKWLADVAALLASAPDGGAAWWLHAQRAGATIPAASAVLLAERLLGMAPPPGFDPPRSLRLSLLMRLAMALIAAGGGTRELATTPWRGWAEMAAKLLAAANWRARAVVGRRLLVSAEDVAELSLPAGFGWLYPVLRVPMLVRRRLGRARRRAQRLHRRGQGPNTAR
ncbi:MAG: nucleotidyltransferase family protein [Sphingomonadales bacterium]|nr:nucleotidyltransferase family protein [Sphingomonadales bacterium]